VQRLEQDIRGQEINKAGMESELQILISQSTDTNELEERLAQLQIKEKDLETEADAPKTII
jgi:exonuclease SbcC